MEKFINLRKKTLNYRPFLIFLLILSLFAIFSLFRPFLVEIIVSTVLVSAFYGLYLKLKNRLYNKSYLAAFIMCFGLLLIIIVPAVNLFVYLGKRAPEMITMANTFVANNENILELEFLDSFGISGIDSEDIENLVLESAQNISNVIVNGVTVFVRESSSMLFSLVIILITMFFFFVDGHRIVKYLILLSPLPNQYDLEIVSQFKRISYVTLVSIFVVAIAQGLIGAIGFLFISWPFWLVFSIMAATSIIPYIGSTIFYVPVVIYLLFQGEIGSAIFIALWCSVIVGNVDELIRAYIIKGKSKINPIFIVFSIMGAISVFGFWGVVIGPLLITITATILHIYELEYKKDLEV